MKWETLSKVEKKKAVHLHMFLKEKFKDGKFVKMQVRLVADGKMQDRTIYTDFSSPTAKMSSVMTCLKLAAVEKWDLLKLAVSGAFLCADMGEDEEVFMFLDNTMSSMSTEWMPHLKEFLRPDGRLTVKVDKPCMV